MGRRGSDDGQITVLIIGFVMIVVLAVGVVANASKAFVYRRSLASWADGAAIAAAQSVAEEVVYAGPEVDELPIAAAEARRVVGEYVARNGLGRRFDDLRVEVGVDQAASTITVEFAVRVPLLLSGDTAGIPVAASASATAPLD
ncbi:MAG TPA: pilus assembly protein TadG-related protein [Jiangellaceae bacterium]|nr:pilus assembly protein TadG-related protein [Jiangellaceae bacterium]